MLQRLLHIFYPDTFVLSNGKTVKEAQQMQVDGVTGATFSSHAVKENVKRGLEYYQKHK